MLKHWPKFTGNECQFFFLNFKFFPISKPVMAVHHMAAHALMPRLEHE